MEDVRRAATARGRASAGVFVAEGRRLLERGLRAGWAPREVLVGSDCVRDAPGLRALLDELSARGARWHEVPDARLLELANGRRAGLLAALFPLPEPLPLETMIAPGGPGRVFLVLVEVTEPGNVGALIRTALASGVAAAICVGASDPFHPKAVRTSLGSVFKLPLARLSSSEGLLEALRAAGVHTLATVAREGVALELARWPAGDVALLVGNEGQGLPARLRDAADGRVTIELSREADSFCVNAAAAVCLYEVQRRRRFALDFPG